MESSFLIYLIIAGLFAFAGYKTWRLIELSHRTSAGKSWPAVMGEVVSKNIEEISGEESSTSYYPKVRYKYSVMGSVFEKEITLHGTFNSQSSEKALAKIGETIEVRYNPQKPEEHITGAERAALGEIFTIAGVVIVAVLMLIGTFF